MCIYRLISPVGKSYVGQTRDYLKRERNRYYHFQRWLKRKNIDGDYRCSNPKLFSAFFKYGVDNFSVEILAENIKNYKCMDRLEMYFIEKYDCVKNGYNVSIGGCNSSINYLTNRGYTYGSSKFSSVSYVDDRKTYLKEYASQNQERLKQQRRDVYLKKQDENLNKQKEYRLSHRDEIRKRIEEYREINNLNRKKSQHFQSESDREFFSTCSAGICFRRFFGGGRTRSFHFIAPHGLLNEQGCWLFKI